ncbi:DUF1573 domain-containing protein [Mangrovibacterium marinum]|uniref:Uncharacterized protein DUF1573 n=1 Tax=Mangrovibacterium marinum TaxID=1639118 RepID=A0A2T5BZP8_9BACT|nr:DUF1573 domain-containing protein [Mangrovibacterium marinum]PTN07776.1 uncharacterized protein DUF1573 [Mangrovibacterium marinum]
MRLPFLLILILAVVACQPASKPAKNEAAAKGEPKFGIQKEIHNFGTIQAGELLSFSFQFSNEGTGELIIDSITADCGCIEINFPKQAITAGEHQYIEVLFNSAGEVGNVLKQIRVYTNADKTAQELLITATVENDLLNIYN